MKLKALLLPVFGKGSGEGEVLLPGEPGEGSSGKGNQGSSGKELHNMS